MCWRLSLKISIFMLFPLIPLLIFQYFLWTWRGIMDKHTLFGAQALYCSPLLRQTSPTAMSVGPDTSNLVCKGFWNSQTSHRSWCRSLPQVTTTHRSGEPQQESEEYRWDCLPCLYCCNQFWQRLWSKAWSLKKVPEIWSIFFGL